MTACSTVDDVASLIEECRVEVSNGKGVLISCDECVDRSIPVSVVIEV